MAEYMNPFAGLPNPQNYQDNPFMREYQTQERQQAVQPFMDMARQSTAMDLQKQTIQNQEFASPEARGARMSEFGAKTSQNKFNIAKAEADLRMLPREEQVKYAELGNKLRSEEAKPFAEQLQELAGLSDILDKTPEQHRPMVYRQWADRTEQKTGRKLPEKFQNYSPQILEESKAIKYGLTMTPAHLQKLGEIQQTAAGNMATAQEHTRSAAAVANINNRGAMDRTKFVTDEGSPKNQAQVLYRLKNTLADPESTQEQKAQAKFVLRSYATKEIYDIAEKATRADRQMLFAGGDIGKNAQARIEATERKIREDIYRNYGIEGEPEQGTKPPTGPGKEQAIQAFGSYEPDKYEYGINPATGRFARKPKGK